MMIPYYIFLSKHGMPFLQTILIIFVVHHFNPTKVMICESDRKEAAKNKEKALEAANSELAADKVRTPPGGRKAEGRPCLPQVLRPLFSPVVVLRAHQ